MRMCCYEVIMILTFSHQHGHSQGMPKYQKFVPQKLGDKVLTKTYIAQRCGNVSIKSTIASMQSMLMLAFQPLLGNKVVNVALLHWIVGKHWAKEILWREADICSKWFKKLKKQNFHHFQIQYLGWHFRFYEPLAVWCRHQGAAAVERWELHSQVQHGQTPFSPYAFDVCAWVMKVRICWCSSN